jgi:HipA-like protein
LDVDEDHEALGAFNSRLIDGPDKVCPNISAVTDPRNFVPLSVEAAAKPKPPAPSGWYDSSFRKAEVFYKDELAGLLTEERKDGKIFYSFRYYRPYKEGPGPAISPDLPKESDIPLNSEPYSVFSEMIGSGERREKQQEYFNLKSDDLFTLLAIVGLRGYPVSVVPISYQPREVRAVRKRAVVYFLGQVAGFLTQVGHRGKTHYRFRYADAYLKSEHPMLSANLPKFPQVYISNRLFGIFEGLLCEGESRQIQQRAFGLSPDDLFGLLMITGPNSLSAITVAPTGTDHSPHATPVSLQRKPKA